MLSGRVKESKRCLYCGDLMQEADMPGSPPDTIGFVCSKCGFVAFFVEIHVVNYNGVRMAKERESISFCEESLANNSKTY
jgi:hypothetical protein